MITTYYCLTLSFNFEDHLRDKSRHNESNRDKKLSALSTDTTCKLNILWHDSNTLCVDCTQVGIFEKTNKVSLRCFLKSKDSSRLETQVGLEVLGDLTNKTLEWSLADEKVS